MRKQGGTRGAGLPELGGLGPTADSCRAVIAKGRGQSQSATPPTPVIVVGRRRTRHSPGPELRSPNDSAWSGPM